MPTSGDCHLRMCPCSRIVPGAPGKFLCCASSSVEMEKEADLALTWGGCRTHTRLTSGVERHLETLDVKDGWHSVQRSSPARSC